MRTSVRIMVKPILFLHPHVVDCARRPKLWLICLLLFAVVLAGCGKHAKTKAPIPSAHAACAELRASAADKQPILVETGIASWYGSVYHNRTAANGEKYDKNQLTAAHRTLPLNSVVRVTNPATKHSTVVCITDRGPFVPGRVIDLSLAAAKATDVWRPGTAPVKLEVLLAPKPLDEGGRWCVQIGGIRKKKDARKLQEKLSKRYSTADVIAFVSPVGVWWVRVRVQDDDRKRAEEVMRNTKIEEGNLFLVRID